MNVTGAKNGNKGHSTNSLSLDHFLIFPSVSGGDKGKLQFRVRSKAPQMTNGLEMICDLAI